MLVKDRQTDWLAEVSLSVKDRLTEWLTYWLDCPLHPHSLIYVEFIFLILMYLLKRNKSFIKDSLSVKDRQTD